MATFKIHQDEENIAPVGKSKASTANFNKQRPVLSVISANLDSEAVQNRTKKIITDQIVKDPVLKIKETVDESKLKKELSNLTVSSDDKENPTVAKKVVTRTPLKELVKIPLAVAEDKKQNKYDSPMSIDGSPKNIELIASKAKLEELYSCLIYRDDIYKYLKQLETQFRPKAYYMKRQPDVTYSMRTILVDWLVEVGEEYKLHNETLFMAVSFLDRFLSSMAVARAKLQLLGTSAMFIAAKFEEIFPPEVSEFTYITDNTYTKKQVLRMENLILKVLSFELSAPTCCTFITHIAASTKLPDKNLFLAMYICELTLLEADPYFDFYPSIIASGAIALARHCLGFIEVWPVNLARTTGYTLCQLSQVIVHLNETHNKSFTSKHVAIRDKYKAAKFESVSQIPFKKLIIRE